MSTGGFHLDESEEEEFNRLLKVLKIIRVAGLVLLILGGIYICIQ